MIATFSNQSRPMFLSPEEWLQHYQECRASGHRTWEPATRDELLLAESCGLLQHHPEWLPCAAGLRILDLPIWFGRRQEALSAHWQERFVQTLIDFPDAIQAVRALILGGQTHERN